MHPTMEELQARDDRAASAWAARVQAKAGEFGEPLAAARTLMSRHHGNISFLAAVALQEALQRHGWTWDLLHSRSENYDRADGPLSTGSAATRGYRRHGRPEVIRVRSWQNYRTGGSGGELDVLEPPAAIHGESSP